MCLGRLGFRWASRGFDDRAHRAVTVCGISPGWRTGVVPLLRIRPAGLVPSRIVVRTAVVNQPVPGRGIGLWSVRASRSGW
jgi:hypothetical protein